MKNNRLKIYMGASVLLGSTLTLTYCSIHQERCPIQYEHAHVYENHYGFKTYFDSEKEQIGEFEKRDIIVEVNHETQVIEENQLFPIAINREPLTQLKEELQPYTEYEYLSQENKTSWTQDSTHPNLTGRARDITYQYIIYRLTPNQDKSSTLDYVVTDDILDNEYEDYLYFKKDALYMKKEGEPYLVKRR